MASLRAPDAVRWIVSTLEKEGFETWTVGGGVRDALSGRRSEDWDFATRARPRDVRRAFRRTVPIGIEHGTIGVLARDGTLYEVTTFRRDVRAHGRHAEVVFADDLGEDLARRDFTINAVAWHPLRDVLHDPFGGRRDMERRVLRTVGKPAERFAEDYLRVLRALRFAGIFRMRIEADTWRSLTAAVDRLEILSAERVHEELQKILSADAPPSRSLALYAAAGVTAALYPELDATVGRLRAQGGEWFSHALETIDHLPPSRPNLRWAALFQALGEEEKAGARERTLLGAAAVLERLRASNAKIREVAELASLAAHPPDAGSGEAHLRRWISGSGREGLRSVVRIWIAALRADEARGRGAAGHRRAELVDLVSRLRQIARSGVPLRVEELALDGRVLIGMGFSPGPHFGEVLRFLLDRVLEDPGRNRADTLRLEAARWLAEHGVSPRVSR